MGRSKGFALLLIRLFFFNIKLGIHSETKPEAMTGYANLSRAASSSPNGLRGLVGRSTAMQRLYELVGRVSQSTSPVFIPHPNYDRCSLSAKPVTSSKRMPDETS